MQTMKRMTACLLAAALLATGMLGCAKESTLDPKSPVALTLWHVYGEQTDSPLNDLIAEFNETAGREQGITVKVTNMTTTPFIKGQLIESVEKAPGAPETPDLFSARPDTVLGLGAENLVDFSEYFSEEDLADYVPEFVEDGIIDERLAIIPVSRSTRALFVNDSQFSRFCADTGASYGDLGTWDGFFDVAAKYFGWSGGQAFCALDYLVQNVEYDMLNGGTEPVYTADGWYDTSVPELKAAWMKFARPLAQGHIVVSDIYANTQMMTGEVIAGVGSSAAINYYNDVVTYPDNASESMKLKVLPLPKEGNGVQYMPVTGTGFAAYKTTEQKAEAAAVFLKWLTQGERNLDFVVEQGYMPVHNGAFDAIEGYDFPSETHAALFEAIQTMRDEYTPTIRPEFVGYYDRVEELYEGLKEMAPGLKRRAESGEDVDSLAQETWEFFCSLA